MDVLQPTHLIFILVVALLVLGPKRLPEVGRSLGRGIRDFRGALSGLTDPDESPSSDASSEVVPVTPATTTLPTDDPATATSFAAVAEHPLTPQPFSEAPAGSEQEQAGSVLLPHIEPDEPHPLSPSAAPLQKD